MAAWGYKKVQSGDDASSRFYDAGTFTLDPGLQIFN